MKWWVLVLAFLCLGCFCNGCNSSKGAQGGIVTQPDTSNRQVDTEVNNEGGEVKVESSQDTTEIVNEIKETVASRLFSWSCAGLLVLTLFFPSPIGLAARMYRFFTTHE